MQPIVIPCPRCGSKLKLRDPALLGKMGKCPQCSTRFELTEPEVVELELAEPAASSGVAEPKVTASHNEFTGIDVSAGSSGVDRLAELRRKSRTRNRRLMWFFAALGIAGVATFFIVMNFREPPKQIEVADRDATLSSAPTDVIPVQNDSEPRPVPLEQGSPIDLRYVPHGAGMLINFRCADLQTQAIQDAKLQACLGTGFTTWLNDELKSRCLFEPAEIAEVKFCFYFSAPGEPCHVAGVVALDEPVKHSEILKRFGGTRRDDIGLPCYTTDSISFLLIDEQTFAFCPTTMVEDWKDTIQRPATTKESFFRILQSSDQLDQLTIIFEPVDIRLHSESLVPKNVLLLVHNIVDWFDETVETVCWGIRMDQTLHSRIQLRSRTNFEQPQMEKTTAAQLQQTPAIILKSIRELHPEKLGTKRVIGRFPAMSLAFQRATRLDRKGGQTTLETVLPALAAPNLALASRLVWQESLRQESSVGTAQVAPPTASLTIAQRLAQPIDCDFRRTPLHEAVAFIGESIGVDFELAGDDLKFIGVTQNMPQEFSMQQVPATAILQRMLTKIGLVIVVDETRQKIIVTSAAAASERGETPFELSPAKVQD